MGACCGVVHIIVRHRTGKEILDEAVNTEIHKQMGWYDDIMVRCIRCGT